MSKVTIFLCAALFAAAVDATYLTNALTAAQQRVEAFVVAEIARVEQNYESAKKRATERSEQLEKAANDFSDKVDEDVKKVEKKVEEDVKKIVAETKDVDVSECNKEKEHLHDLASVVMSNMTACIVDKKENGKAYVENINLEATDVIGNLSAIRDESHRCGENVGGIASALSAIACTKMAGVKAAWVSARSVPALSVNMAKMNYLLSTVQPSLAYCTTTHGLAKFYHEARMIIRNTKICVQQKVDEARRSSTTVKDEAVETETEVVPTEKIDAETAAPEETTEAEEAVAEETSEAEAAVPEEATEAEEAVSEETTVAEAAVPEETTEAEAAALEETTEAETEAAPAEP